MARRKSIMILPELKDRNGDLSKEWFVEYSVRNPKTEVMERFRISKGINHFVTIAERRKAAAVIVADLSQKLKNGWTPFTDDQNVYSDTLVYDAVAKNYGRAKKANRNVRFVASKFIAFKEGKVAEKSFNTYKSKLRLFVSWCENKRMGDVDISFIKNEQVKQFFDFVISDRNLDKMTVKKYRQIMFAFFAFAETKYGIKNPVHGIELPVKKVDNAARPILKHDLVTLLDAIEPNDPQLYLAMMIQYYTAIRPGNEMQNLKIKDIDFYNNQAVVSAVTAKKERRIASIPKQLIDIMIEKYLLHRFNPEFYVFGRARVPGPEKIGQNTLRNRFNLYRDKLNLPTHYKYYSLKHTAAGKLLESGRTIVEVKDWCGHKRIEHTEHYIKRHFGIKNSEIINNFPSPRG